MRVKNLIEEKLSEPYISICNRIVDVVLSDDVTEKYTLEFLYSHMIDVDNKEFKSAAFLLANKCFDFYSISFELPYRKKVYQIPSSYVLDAIRARDYKHPITQKVLSEKEFGKKIKMYFIIT